MVSVEEKIKNGGLVSGAPTNLLEEMKLLKEMQDQTGLFFAFFWSLKNFASFFFNFFLKNSA